MNYNIGDVVEVRKGFKDFDNDKYDLGGWQAVVTDMFENEDEGMTVELVWTAETLQKKIPANYYIESMQNEWVWSEYSIDDDEDVTKVNKTFDEEETVRAQLEIEKRFYWYQFGDEGMRIMQIINGLESDNDTEAYLRWQKAIEKEAKFPVPCVVKEHQFVPKLRQGDEFLLKRIVSIDANIGLIVEGDCRNEVVQIQLSNLDVKNNKSKLYTLFADYAFWFDNFPSSQNDEDEIDDEDEN